MSRGALLLAPARQAFLLMRTDTGHNSLIESSQRE